MGANEWLLVSVFDRIGAGAPPEFEGLGRPRVVKARESFSALNLRPSGRRVDK